METVSGFYGADDWEAAKIDEVAELYLDFEKEYMPWHMVNAGYTPGDKVL